MNIRKIWITVACLALFGVVCSSIAVADAWDKATKVTINSPVEVPGAILQPGTYVFKVLPNTNGNIVQIWNADQTKLITTALTEPDYRLRPADKPIITFDENPANPVPAVKAWFYPGEQMGRVFVYPKARATELAKRTKQDVLSMADSAASNMTEPAKSAQDAPAAALMVVVVKAVDPTGQEVDQSQAVQSRPNH
jgi:hypothetical protein